MSWRPAPSIVSLQRDLDRAFPNRTRPDWIIGDTAHSHRDSDHNPDGKGMVHAIDIRLGGGLNAKRVLETVIGDPRVWYVIHNRIIYSRTHGWEARRYTGSNPHTTHIHVSIRYTHAAENNTSAWVFETPAKAVKTKPVPISLANAREQFRRALGVEKGKVERSPAVRKIQRALKARGYDPGPVDGYVGKKTLNAWGQWERAAGGRGRPRVPDRESLGKLVAPRWKMVN